MSAEVESSHAQVSQDGTDMSSGFQRLSMSEGHHEGEGQIRSEEEYASEQLTLRAIVTSKEAGVIIGKAGKNVADLRDQTGVRAGVSKVVPGVHDRVLTVTGGLDQISKAYGIVAKGLLEGAPQVGMGGVINTNGTHRKFSSFPSHTATTPLTMMSHNQPSSHPMRIRILKIGVLINLRPQL
jgi:heterogeneous nuclear rnp K-like protein 2